MAINLNDEQIKAVNHVNGPLLILAGAGSGKTRVLTERIANLIADHNISPYNILAVTFTNKAAKEMKERVSNRIGESMIKNLWIGTFHSICSKILRMEIYLLGRSSNFVVYDTADQQKLMKECVLKANLDEKTYKPNIVLGKVSRAKSNGYSPEDYLNNSLTYGEQRIGDLYMMYEEALRKNNALDFDDLLFYVVKLFREHPKRLEHYQQKFRYIMVDEYQDTNMVQYELIKLLADKYRNICVVGDVDQSIYSFRNADFRIILNFQKDYQDAKVIKLEKNYRSTRNILDLSNKIIENNQNRFPKNLFTDNETGEMIRVFEAENDEEEVRFVIREIARLMNTGKFDYNDFTVLYRTNAQSRIFEEYFVSFNIPHQVIGSFRFFERKEIKDILSYLRVIHNPNDSISLQRVINTPKRGIGATTIKKLATIADDFNLSLWDVLNFETQEGINASTQRAIKEFVKVIRFLMEESNTVPVSGLIKSLLADTGYFREIEESEKKDEAAQRLENIYQLINSAIEFEMKSDDVSLEAYLSYISLVSDVDSLEENSQNVKLMTVHTSKGLEFPVVFITGMAEGVFPHLNSLNSEAELEEERRLMYVASTRAKKMLYLTFPRRMFVRDGFQNLIPSRFIMECPQEVVHGYNINPYLYERELQKAEERKASRNREYEVDAWYDPDDVKNDKYTYNLKKSIKTDPREIQASLERRYSNSSTAVKSNNFKEGDRVKSSKFGEGTISKILKNSNKTLLIINFDKESGNKIIDPQISGIQKL